MNQNRKAFEKYDSRYISLQNENNINIDVKSSYDNKYNIGDYNTAPNNGNNEVNFDSFNGKLTFGVRPETSLPPKRFDNRSDNRSVSQNKPIQKDFHIFQKANSLRQINFSSSPSQYELATFINKLGSHNSFLSVIIHLIYKVKFLRKFVTTEIKESTLKNYSLLKHLKSVLLKYPENKKIDLSKLRYAISQNFQNSNEKNKFDVDSPNDPCEFYNSFINMIHCLYNNKSPVDKYKIENCSCLAHRFVYLNIVKHDECECSAINRTNCSLHNCIIDIPIEAVIKMSQKHSSIFYSKDKLFSYFKNLIHFQGKLECPLNGRDCNYNRVKRKLILNNPNSLPAILSFYFETSSQYLSLVNILNALVLIPNFFDIDSIFTFNSIHNNTQYEFFGIVFRKYSKTFTCAFKNEEGGNPLKWIYYDDENVTNFPSWGDLISICLKNGLMPYMIFYRLKEEEEEIYGDEADINIKKNSISKGEFKILETYAKRIDDFKINPSLQNRVREELIITYDDKRKPTKKKSELNLNSATNVIRLPKDHKREGSLNKSNSMSTNPYKREKKSVDNTKNEIKAKKYENMPLQITRKSPPVSAHSEKDKMLSTQKIVYKPAGYAEPKSMPSPQNTQNMNSYKRNYPTEIEKVRDIPYSHITKSSDYVEGSSIPYQEDRIRLYKERKQPADLATVGNSLKRPEPTLSSVYNTAQGTILSEAVYYTENKPSDLEMWICSNCNSVNKASDYKCRKCKLINNRQRDLIEKIASNPSTEYKQIINKSAQMILRGQSKSGNSNSNNNNNNNNLNAAFKRVSCLCYSNCKAGLVKNGVCSVCQRVVEQEIPIKKGIVEKEIVYKTSKGNKSRSKESSPEQKIVKKLGLQSNHSDNASSYKKTLAVNRYEDEENIKVGMSNNLIKNIKISKEYVTKNNYSNKNNSYTHNKDYANKNNLTPKGTAFIKKKK